MENQTNNQQSESNGKEITNEFLIKLRELANICPKNISLTIIAAENEPADKKVFQGLMIATGSSKKIFTMYQDMFKRVPELKEIVFDAVSSYKFREAMNTDPKLSLFESIFGSFKR